MILSLENSTSRLLAEYMWENTFATDGKYVFSARELMDEFNKKFVDTTTSPATISATTAFLYFLYKNKLATRIGTGGPSNSFRYSLSDSFYDFMRDRKFHKKPEKKKKKTWVKLGDIGAGDLPNTDAKLEATEPPTPPETFEDLATQILYLVAKMEKLQPNLSKISNDELMDELQRRMMKKS